MKHLSFWACVVGVLGSLALQNYLAATWAVVALLYAISE